jgi:hypothetical protein
MNHKQAASREYEAVQAATALPVADGPVNDAIANEVAALTDALLTSAGTMFAAQCRIVDGNEYSEVKVAAVLKLERIKNKVNRFALQLQADNTTRPDRY